MTPENAFWAARRYNQPDPIVLVLDQHFATAKEIVEHLYPYCQSTNLDPVIVGVSVATAQKYVAVERPPADTIRIVSIGDTVTLEDHPIGDSLMLEDRPDRSGAWHREPLSLASR